MVRENFSELYKTSKTKKLRSKDHLYKQIYPNTTFEEFSMMRYSDQESEEL